MHRSVVVFACANSILLAGCGDIHPACETSQARSALMQAVAARAVANKAIHIEHISTLRTNYVTGEVLCAATVVTTDIFANKEKSTIGFNVQYDGQNQLHVSVYGTN